MTRPHMRVFIYCICMNDMRYKPYSNNNRGLGGGGADVLLAMVDVCAAVIKIVTRE